MNVRSDLAMAYGLPMTTIQAVRSTLAALVYGCILWLSGESKRERNGNEDNQLASGY